MNFNTTNMTFRQLMANGLSYRVPQFQRDYSWDVDHWDDLWLDIVGLFGDEPEPAHYMGYLVLQSADSRSFDIIDGQQRMTTLSLLMLASVSHLTELAVPDLPDDPQLRRAQQLRSNYIGYLDPVTLVPRSKLTLNRHDDRFYQNYLIPLERLPQRGLNASEHLLRQAFNSLKDRIKEYCGKDGQSVARFVDAAVDKLFFEAMYNRIARDVSEGRIAGVATAVEALRPVYPEDGEFRAAFIEKSFRTTSSRNRKGVRFILFKLEERLSRNSYEFENARYGIEHVLPENPGDDWQQFNEQQREASTYRLGNMTLLDSSTNRQLGNIGFTERQRAYLESEFSITRKLGEEFDTWTVDKIRVRQGWMAKQASSIWQVNF